MVVQYKYATHDEPKNTHKIGKRVVEGQQMCVLGRVCEKRWRGDGGEEGC